MMNQNDNSDALGNFLKAINDKFAEAPQLVVPIKKVSTPKKNGLKDNQLNEAFDIINDLQNILPGEAKLKIDEVLKNIESLDKEKKAEAPKSTHIKEEKIEKLNESLNESTTLEDAVENSTKYKLYRDRDETFECKISVEGSSLSYATVRLVLEAEPWNLIFTGKIYTDGRCVVPLKRLTIYNEGTIGKASLEVTVDGSLFIPWEETFIVEGNKKVSVEVKKQETIVKRTS